MLVLHSLLRKTSSVAPLVPPLIQRLACTRATHQQAADIVEGISFVQRDRCTIREELERYEGLLDNVSLLLLLDSHDMFSDCPRFFLLQVIASLKASEEATRANIHQLKMRATALLQRRSKPQ
jgi:hypothetical protein